MDIIEIHRWAESMYDMQHIPYDSLLVINQPQTLWDRAH